MKNTTKTFYYSRHKLGLYLLFNFGLLALTILFTWSIFPDYKPIYFFAITTCCLSVLSSLFVFLIRMPLAKINDQGLKIDCNNLLPWSNIDIVEHLVLKGCFSDRHILKITPKNLSDYKMSFMQKIAGKSIYGAFSIPLYAMTEKNAKSIERLLVSYLKPQKKELTKAKSKAKTKKGSTKKSPK